MIKINYLLFIVLAILLLSCDFIGKYEFRIKNELKGSIRVNFINKSGQKDTTINVIIPQDSTSTIMITGSEILGMTEEVQGVYSDTIEALHNLKIYYDTMQLNKNYQIVDEWQYKLADKRHGIYTLTIDSTNLKIE